MATVCGEFLAIHQSQVDQGGGKESYLKKVESNLSSYDKGLKRNKSYAKVAEIAHVAYLIFASALSFFVGLNSSVYTFSKLAICIVALVLGEIAIAEVRAAFERKIVELSLRIESAQRILNAKDLLR